MIEHPEVTLVTGAAGWLGTALMAALTGDGPWARDGEIRPFVRNRVEADAMAASHALDQYHTGDTLGHDCDCIIGASVANPANS